jgi:hypothetical protein
MNNQYNTRCEDCRQDFERDDTEIDSNGDRVCTGCLEDRAKEGNQEDIEEDRRHDEMCALGRK